MQPSGYAVVIFLYYNLVSYVITFWKCASNIHICVNTENVKSIQRGDGREVSSPEPGIER